MKKKVIIFHPSHNSDMSNIKRELYTFLKAVQELKIVAENTKREIIQKMMSRDISKLTRFLENSIVQ